VTSPNEPGAANKGDKGDSLNGDGSAERSGAHRATPAPAGPGPETGDSPPWQRGAARTSSAAQRPAPEPARDPRSSGPAPTADARLNRFISGPAASGAGAPAHAASQTQEFDAPPARGDGPSTDAYASELPDLSGPTLRGGQRKPAPERSSAPPDTAGKSRPAAESRVESRDQRESRVKVSRRGRGPVRASMQIRRIDPWSTLKVSLLLSVALFFVWMIAVAFLYLVLGGMGVWAKLNSNVGDLLNNTSGSAGELVSSGTIFGGAVLIGLVNIVLLTAMATIAAFVYNLTTDLIGGVEVTLADLD
jgi:Transmembrane domain of unknown function (DUF3566)